MPHPMGNSDELVTEDLQRACDIHEMNRPHNSAVDGKGREVDAWGKQVRHVARVQRIARSQRC